MKQWRWVYISTVFLLVFTVLFHGRSDATEVTIDEWKVPWDETRPRDPYVGPDGNVWFVGQRGDYVARFTPQSGEFKRFDLEPRTGPHNNIVDAKGFVWYAGNRSAHIGKLDPKTGKITKYPMPEGVIDPHTLIFDGKGNIWFTAQQSNFVGKLDMKSGQVNAIKVPTPWARPYGIVMDSHGRVWFNEFARNKIGMINSVTMKLKEYKLPRKKARGRRIAVSSDGGVWYVDYRGGFLGRLDPETSQVKEWAVPGGSGSKPYGLTIDERDRLWFVETGPEPNRLVGFDPLSAQFFSSTTIKSGAGSVRNMVYDASRRQIWFGTDFNTIGRAQLP